MSSLYLLEDAVYFALQTSGAGSTIAINKYMIEKSDIVIGKNIDVNNDNIHLNGDTVVKETLEVKKDVTAKKDVNVEQTVTAKVLNATTAANGSFATSDNKTVTVVNGIVTVIQ